MLTGCDVAGGDQAQRGVAGGRDDVVPPGFIRLTISSEVPNALTLTLQPVSFSNGVTQSTFGSVRAVLGVAGPGQDVDLALALADLLEHRQVGRGRSRGRLPPRRRLRRRRRRRRAAAGDDECQGASAAAATRAAVAPSL